MNKIEWTDKTWNVITGCTEISAACDNCYAKAMTKCLQGMARKEAHKSMLCEFCRQEMSQRCDSKYHLNMYQCLCRENNAIFKRLPKYYLGWDKVVFHKESLNDILDKKKYPSGSKIFVNSMSDTFHEDIEPYCLTTAFDYMRRRQDLIFQILTKRAKNMLDYFNGYVFDGYLEEHSRLENYFRSEMYKHIWFGVTAENQQYVDERIPYLLRLKNLFKDYFHQDLKIFVSIEPCLENIDLSAYIEYLDWVILGGEKIPNNPNKSRPLKTEYAESIWNQCRKKDVPFFFKQWGNNVEESIKREKYPFLPMWIEKHKEFPYQKEWIVEVSGCGGSNFYEKVEFDTRREAMVYRANEYVNRRIFHKDTHRLAREHRERLRGIRLETRECKNETTRL